MGEPGQAFARLDPPAAAPASAFGQGVGAEGGERAGRQVVEAWVTRSIRAKTTVSAAYLSKPRSPLWWVTL